MASNDNENRRKTTCFRRFSRSTEMRLRKFFYNVGFVVAGNPWKTMGLSALLCILCVSGMVRFHTESRPTKLWVPQDTVALKHDKWVSNTFVPFIRPEKIIFTSQTEGGDLANKKSLLEIIEVLKFSETTVVDFKENGQTTKLTYANMCEKAFDDKVSYCSTRSVLDLFYNSSLITSPPNFYDTIMNKIKALSDPEIKKIISQTQFRTWNGNFLKKSDIMGGVSGSGENIKVASFRTTQYLKNNLVEKNGERKDEKADEWEKAWVEKLNGASIPNAKSLKWNLLALVSADVAAEESLTGDISKIAIGYIILSIYVCNLMGEFHRVKSRVLLAMMGLLSVGLAIAATYGIGSALGMFFGPVHQVLPLLLLGIGIDDAFVIVTALDGINHDERYRSLSVREKVAKALSKAGASVTVTSLTNSCAFFIGSLTSLPSLRYFAIWAGIGILFDYVLQTTFFTACLTLDARRQEAKKLDFTVCITSKRDDVLDEPNCCGSKPGTLSRFFEFKFAPCITHKYFRIVTLLLTFTGFSVCVYGFTQLKQDFQPEFFYIDGTYSKAYDDAEKAYFPNRNIPVSVYTGDIDYTSSDVQKKMNLMFASKESNGLLTNDPFVETSTLISWYSSFRQFLKLESPSAVMSPTDYYPNLKLFLNSSSGARFQNDLVFTSDNKQLKASRSNLLMVPLRTNDEEVDAMKSLRKTVEKAQLDDAFPFSFFFIFYEQYAVIESEAVTNVIASLAVVFAVALVLIGDPIVAIITLLGVGFSVIDILGIVHFWDINLNSVSVINLALAVGLCIDFSAHIGLAFMEAVGTRTERVTNALKELGPPLVHGGISTFLAVSVLVAAKSYIFRIFFKMFFLIIGLGMFHGMVMVPQILSFVGPVGHFDNQEEKDDEEDLIEKHAQRWHIKEELDIEHEESSYNMSSTPVPDRV